MSSTTNRGFPGLADPNASGARKQRSRQPVPAPASAVRGDSRASDACRASLHWLEACWFAALFFTCPGCAPALAGQYDYGAGFALTHDSNITRTSTDPRAEWTEALFAGIAYAERTVDLTARLLAQVERRNFVRNTYRDDTGYFLNGAAVWTITPQQLSWTVEDIATESLLNLTAPDTPANRTKTNSLSTGPEFAFRLNPVNQPIIGARYGRYDIQGPGDNQRYTGYARWLHRLSEPEKLSLNYEVTRVDFTPPALFPNFLRQDQFLGYETLSPLNSLIFEAGTTRVQRYGGDQTNGRLVRLAALHALTSETAVRLNLSDQISDTATDLIRGVARVTSTMTPATPFESAAAVPLTGSNVATGDVYRGRRGELIYVTQGGRIGYNVQGYARRVDFVTLEQNYREVGGNVSLTWTQTDTVRVYAYADYLKRTFPSLARTVPDPILGPNFDERDTYRTAALGVTYRLTPKLSVSAEGRRQERDSKLPPDVPSHDFVDKRFMLVLGYSTGPLYTASSRR